MGRNVITKKALTLEQFTGFVKEKRERSDERDIKSNRRVQEELDNSL